MFLGAFFLLTQTPPALVQPEPRPSWISTLPQTPGRIYAVGMADLLGSEAEARTKAASRARVEVIARLRSTVKGELVQQTQTRETRTEGGASSGSGERSTLETSQVSARAENVPGLSVESVYVDASAHTVFALACLDESQAKMSVGSQLEALTKARLRIKDETSRKARWRLRQLRGDLGRLEELSALLATSGLLGPFPAQLQAERQAVEERLAVLESANLPPMDLASTTLALRANAELPGGVQDYLEARIKAQGPAVRAAGADFTLDLLFGGGAKGPEFIYSEMTFAAGVLYHLDAKLRILDANGIELTRTSVVSLTQAGSPEGLVEQFRKQFERRLPRLLDELMAEMK